MNLKIKVYRTTQYTVKEKCNVIQTSYSSNSLMFVSHCIFHGILHCSASLNFQIHLPDELLMEETSYSQIFMLINCVFCNVHIMRVDSFSQNFAQVGSDDRLACEPLGQLNRRSS